MNQTVTNHEYGLTGGKYIAIKLRTGSALIGFKMSTVQFAMKTNNSGGTIYCRRWNSSDEVQTNYWNVDVSSIGSTVAYYGNGITTDDESATEEGDYIGVELQTSGSDLIDVKAEDSDVYDGTKTCLDDNGSIVTDRDMTFKLTGCPNQ